MVRLRRYLYVIASSLLLLTLTGCGAVVEQTIQLNHDGSGQIKIVAKNSVQEIDQYAGGVDKVKAVLLERIPDGWDLGVVTGNGWATFTLSSSFANPDELKTRLVTATATKTDPRWSVSRTPFYRRDQLEGIPTDRVWAKWAVDAVGSLTSERVVGSVRSHVNWFRYQTRELKGVASFEQRAAVDKIALSLHWTPDEITRTVEVIPAEGKGFQPMEEWLKAVSGATVTVRDEAKKIYEMTTSSKETPWSSELTTTRVKHNLFWDRLVVQETGIDLERWIGPKVPVKEVSYTFSGQGWWSTADQGPPE